LHDEGGSEDMFVDVSRSQAAIVGYSVFFSPSFCVRPDAESTGVQGDMRLKFVEGDKLGIIAW
jgi:hypothetical protein